MPEQFQRPLGVGLLRAEELALSLGPDAIDVLDDVLDDMQRAMADVPHAMAWARRFASGTPRPTAKQFRKRCAPHLMSCAVRGIGDSDAPDLDARLYDLLATAISTGQRFQPSAPTVPVVVEQPAPWHRRLAAAVWR
jgi:hypothetical protein